MKHYRIGFSKWRWYHKYTDKIIWEIRKKRKAEKEIFVAFNMILTNEYKLCGVTSCVSTERQEPVTLGKDYFEKREQQRQEYEAWKNKTDFENEFDRMSHKVSVYQAEHQQIAHLKSAIKEALTKKEQDYFVPEFNRRIREGEITIEA